MKEYPGCLDSPFIIDSELSGDDFDLSRVLDVDGEWRKFARTVSETIQSLTKLKAVQEFFHHLDKITSVTFIIIHYVF